MTALLAITGMILIFLEFFLPGAIMAIGGGILLIASLVLMVAEGCSLTALLIYSAVLAVSLFLTMRIALSRVKKGAVTLKTDQEGYQACVYPKEMVGKSATALCDLKPSGYVEFEGQSFPALSKLGYIEKGSLVRLIGGEGASFIVVQEVSHDATTRR